MGHYIPWQYARYANEIIKAGIMSGRTMFKRKGAWKVPLQCQLKHYDLIHEIQFRELKHDKKAIGVLGMTRESILKQRRKEKRINKEDKAIRKAIGKIPDKKLQSRLVNKDPAVKILEILDKK